MAMEINGSYGNAQISYLERRREEQPLEKTSGTAQSKEGQKEEKTPVQDEYISRVRPYSGKNQVQSPPVCTGLERMRTATAKSFMMTRKSPNQRRQKRLLTKKRIPRTVLHRRSRRTNLKRGRRSVQAIREKLTVKSSA